MPKQESIGALWQKESDKGTYFTGNIEINGQKVSIVVFSNNYKKEEKHPDWRIFISQPRKQAPNQMEGEQPEYGYSP